MLSEEDKIGGARRHFTDAFKREAGRLCNQPGATVTQIAHDLDIGDNVLRR